MRLSGPPMLVAKLEKQALRPKRIASLALPLAALGGPVTAGVRLLKAQQPQMQNVNDLTPAINVISLLYASKNS